MTIARIWFDLVVAGIATAGFGLLFRTEGKSLLPCAVIGGAGYIVYDWIVLEFASAPVAAFISCLLVGLIAEAAARILKGPTIVFATMGIIPMVPGYGMYRTMEAVVQGDYEKGILICGTGMGISIAANKIHGVRAALCGDCYSAEMCRRHNNANVLALGGRVLGVELAKRIVDTFLTAPFEGGRHQRRVDLISALETEQ